MGIICSGWGEFIRARLVEFTLARPPWLASVKFTVEWYEPGYWNSCEDCTNEVIELLALCAPRFDFPRSGGTAGLPPIAFEPPSWVVSRKDGFCWY